jgi:AcrR family transcriptional regulator
MALAIRDSRAPLDQSSRPTLRTTLRRRPAEEFAMAQVQASRASRPTRSTPVAGRGRPRGRELSDQAVGGATRDRILDVAEALFAERGLAGTSMRDIAARVGVTPASLYNHFLGKEALYAAVLERGVQPLLEKLRSFRLSEEAGGVYDRDRAPDIAGEILDGIVRHLAKHPHLPRLVYHETLSGGAVLSELVHAFARPLVSQALATLRADPRSPWTEEEQPLVIATWLQVILGHFALAPLSRAISGDDPLSRRGLADFTRFLAKLARRIHAADSPTQE